MHQPARISSQPFEKSVHPHTLRLLYWSWLQGQPYGAEPANLVIGGAIEKARTATLAVATGEDAVALE